MVLKSIELKNFRLHKKTALHFSEDLNFIIGGNGQGKTTLLESVYYLCTTKSLNQSGDAESVSFDEDRFEVKGEFAGLTNDKVEVYFDRASNKKSYFLNGKQIYQGSQIIGKYPVVVLIQSDHAITMGSPGDRRKFIDSIISQSSDTYLKILIDYNKSLRQRSALLSTIRERSDGGLLEQLDAWTSSLIKLGTEIVKHRIKFVDVFNGYIKETYGEIMGEKEVPEIKYSFLNAPDLESVEQIFNETINKKKDEEIRRATNLVGPHRDDFTFFINGLELKKFGSQGQHKTYQIALRFGQYFYLKDKLGREPLFLMDDIFGELDIFRAGKISRYLKKIGQAFITITDFSNIEYLNISSDDKKIEVKNGTALYV